MSAIKIAICFLLLLCGFGVFSQEGKDISPKELIKMAVLAERANDPYQAIDFYEKYLLLKGDEAKVNYRLAEQYRRARNYIKGAENYRKAYEGDPSKFSKALFYEAEMLQSMGEYEQARKLFEQFRKEYRGEKDARLFSSRAKAGIAGCQMAMADSINNKVLISHLGGSINKAHIESSPIFYKNLFLFTSLPMEELQYFSEKNDSLPTRAFYYATEVGGEWKNNGLWTEVSFPEGANISSGTFSVDGERFYFSACGHGPMGNFICKIWKTERFGQKWTEPQALSDNINSFRYTSTQPAVGVDYKGREVLYFVSDREGGKGGSDIWYSRYNKRKETFDEARNCGSKINTEGDEMTPFIHVLNNSLYFSSDGHPGYGGLDVFKSTGERGKWEEPMNLGTPINTSVDELYYALKEKGEQGAFASNRKESIPLKNQHCCDDLYSFHFTDFISIAVHGDVRDENGIQMENVKVQLFQYPKGDEEGVLLREVLAANGEYDFHLEAGKTYRLKTKKAGYLLSERSISTKTITQSTELNYQVKMEKIPFTALVIENIYYDFDSPELTEDAKNTIDTTILKIMVNNPEIIAEISSHTDSKGTDAYNKHLSQKRAESVVKYLRTKGIDKKRMQAKGYGESKHIAPNINDDGSDNVAGRAKNRRTEFKVIGLEEVLESEE